MKAVLALLFVFLSGVFARAQGTVAFANSTSTRIYVGSGTFSPITGTNAYRIGLFVAPRGTTDEHAFTLVALTTNAPQPIFAGLFNGGSPLALPNGYPAGQPINFQVRVWSLAPEYVNCSYAGLSEIGFVTPGDIFGTPGILFGPSAGQVPGFNVYVPCPEPSTVMLAALGAAALLLVRRNSKGSRPSSRGHRYCGTTR